MLHLFVRRSSLVLCLVVLGCQPVADGVVPVHFVATPSRGGELRMLQSVSPSNLDPLGAQTVYDVLVVNQLYDGLVASDVGLGVRPALAESWTVSRDGLEFTFALRPGVRFHDGTRLRARDVKFSLSRPLAPAAPSTVATPYLAAIRGSREFTAGVADTLEGIEVIDDSTLRIHLVRPIVSFLSVLALDPIRVVPEHVVAADPKALVRQPVGTGPFVLADWTDSELRLIRNEGYFGGPAHLDAVRLVLPDEGAADSSQRLIDDQLDVIVPFADQLEELRAAEDVAMVEFPGLNLFFLGLDSRVPPFDDVRIRQAVAHAIDRRALTAASDPVFRTATGILPPGMNGYSPQPKVLPYDPGRSRELLAEAGYPSGAGLPRITLLAAGGGLTARTLERVCQDLEAVGIPIAVHNVPWSELRAAIRTVTPLYALGWIADLADEEAFLRPLVSGGSMEPVDASYDSEVMDRLDRALTETDPAQRLAILRAAEGRILELAPIVPLHHTNGVIAIRTRVHGLRFGALGLASLDLEQVWLTPPAMAQLGAAP